MHHVVVPHESVPIDVMNGLPERISGWCAAVAGEVNRIHLITSVDLVLGPNWDVEPLLVHHQQHIPVVLTLHAPLATVMATDERLHANSEADALLRAEAHLTGRVNYVLCASQAILHEISARSGVQIPKGRTSIVPRGMADVPDRPRLSNRSTAVPEVLFVGRLEPRKGVAALLASIPLVLDVRPGALFAWLVIQRSQAPARTELRSPSNLNKIILRWWATGTWCSPER